VLWELLGQNFIPCGTAVFRVRVLTALACSIKVSRDLTTGISGYELLSFIQSCMEEPVLWWRQSTPHRSKEPRLRPDCSAEAFSNSRNLAKPAASRERSRTMKRGAWRRFSTNMCAHLSYQAWRALRDCQLLRQQEISWLWYVWFLRQMLRQL